MIKIFFTTFIILGLVVFNVNGNEQITRGFHSPWNPPTPYCELAQFHVELSVRNAGMAAQLTNAGSCKYFSGDTDTAIELWAEAYILGRTETLKPLARVSSLLDSKTQRALGMSLLQAYSKQNSSYRYQIPLFKALQIMAFEPKTKANNSLVIDNLATAFQLEADDIPFETFQFISYLKSIKYFQDNLEEAANLFSKIELWEKEIKFSNCYISEALEFDMYKLPSDHILNEYFKEKCISENNIKD
ncbi:hypothetical protein [Paraglaciecola sp. 25GB23A]|uniref:hypothetical protein n=1 Tax=Paraglaciecola sp. 25GB23A TaxID=3156068 RepID=UPI0032B00722